MDKSQSAIPGNVAVIVAHPDDETLWAGGTMLMHPQTRWTILALCRKSDPDRAPKFFRAAEHLGAAARMADLDDSSDQKPLPQQQIQNTILKLLSADKFDLIITHSLKGEYTKHLRHEETAAAVQALWQKGKLTAPQVWMFAYEDGSGQYLPQPIKTADIIINLPREIWQKKYDIITKVYGFGPDSFEAKTTPVEESFWCLKYSN